MGEGPGQADGEERGALGANGAPGADGAAGGDAALLGEMKALRRRARAARHAYWFPLALFGVLIGASVPFYIQQDIPGVYAGQGAPSLPVLGGYPGIVAQRYLGYQWYLGYYWLAALLVGLLATLLWYRWNARRVGLATPARGYVVTVAVLTFLALAVPPLSQVRSPHWLSWLQHLQVLLPGDLTIRGTFPLVIIAAGLWVLTWAERSPALAVVVAVYTGTAVLASLYNVENVLFRLGWNPSPSEWSLTSLPNVLLPCLVLLAAAAGAFAVQRHRRPPAADAPAAFQPPGSPGSPEPAGAPRA